MADSKISDLAAVTDVLDTDEFVLARAGATKKIDGVDLKAEIVGAWTTYVPTLTGSGSNPTLGAGSSVVGQYVEIGKTVHFVAKILFGTSGVAAGSGTYSVSLPVAMSAAFNTANPIVGSTWQFDSSAGVARWGMANPSSTTTVAFWLDSATTATTHASPWTWAASDQIWVSGTYEAA